MRTHRTLTFCRINQKTTRKFSFVRLYFLSRYPIDRILILVRPKMSNESTKNFSPSFSPPPPPPSVPSSSAIDSYIGSFLSLTSKYEIRYEGVLSYLNPQDSTLSLTNVRSYGTEGRKKDGPQIPPSDRVYEYIMFRGSDIKDLQVKSSPPAQKEELIQNDPAIIQSHSLLGPSSSSKPVPADGGNLTQVSSFQEPSVLTNAAYPGTLPSLYQSGTPMAPSQATQSGNVASLAMPTYWPGYSGMSSNIPYASQHANPLLPVSVTTPSLSVANQNLVQPFATSASINLGLTYPSNKDSNYVHLSNIHSLCPEQRPNSSSVPSLLSVKPSLPSHPAFLTANRLPVSPFPSSRKEMSVIEAPIIDKSGSDSVPGLSFQSLPYSASSAADSTLGSLLERPPALLTPNQLAQPRPPLLPSTQYPYLYRKDTVAINPTPNLSSSIATPAVQAPLLPLPHTAQQFTEEFDFEAMNEKFKKEEVWGYLGGAKQRAKAEGMEDAAVGQNLGHVGSYGSAPSLDPNPAYNKDDFFDTISCNSVARGPRTGQNRFSDRMRHDTATFGNVHQRPHLGYGGYGAAGENFRDSFNNWERRYNYGGRGRGGNWRI